MNKAYKIATSVIALVMLWLANDGARAQQDSREYLVKAAFLFNFAKFIEWPEDQFETDDSPINLCIIGTNPFGNALTALSSKKVRGHKIEVAPLASISSANHCHIAFIALDNPADRDKTLSELRDLPVLTVGDFSNFADAGGLIEFTPVKNKIGFVINRSAAAKVNLTISSKLLALAEDVL